MLVIINDVVSLPWTISIEASHQPRIKVKRIERAHTWTLFWVFLERYTSRSISPQARVELVKELSRHRYNISQCRVERWRRSETNWLILSWDSWGIEVTCVAGLSFQRLARIQVLRDDFFAQRISRLVGQVFWRIWRSTCASKEVSIISSYAHRVASCLDTKIARSATDIWVTLSLLHTQLEER